MEALYGVIVFIFALGFYYFGRHSRSQKIKELEGQIKMRREKYRRTVSTYEKLLEQAYQKGCAAGCRVAPSSSPSIDTDTQGSS